MTAGSAASAFEVQYNAIALREETVVNSESTGYVNFFVGDSTPIRTGEKTCIIDASGKVSAKLEEAAKNQELLNEENLGQIQNMIYDFDASFDPMNYEDAYSFKYRVQSRIMDLINNSVFKNINEDLEDLGENSYEIVKSKLSGVLIHYVDGFEGKSPDQIESTDFKKANYEKKIIKANDLISTGDPLYKVSTSEVWNLVIQINDPNLFAEMPYVNIEFLKDNITAAVDVETFTKAGNTYAVLKLQKYMIRYLSDRFLQIKILDNTTEGLKIPKTAVAERQYYAIPVEYITQGGNSSSDGFNKEVIGEDGTTSVTFVTPPIIRKTEKFCYVDTSGFEAGDVLVMPESNNRYQVGEKENLQGVYTVNNGYASFRLIDIIGENNSFYIISSKTPSGVRVFDQVIRNGSKVNEGDVVNR